MSLRRFLNVAYAILVEEYQRLGVDLISTLEKLSEWGESKEPDRAQPSRSTATQNQQSYNMLGQMMSGVKRV